MLLSPHPTCPYILRSRGGGALGKHAPSYSNFFHFHAVVDNNFLIGCIGGSGGGGGGGAGGWRRGWRMIHMV